MYRRRALAVMGGLMLCPLCAAESFFDETHWSYEGTTGPDKWGDLDPASKLCSFGSQPSPYVGPAESRGEPYPTARWHDLPELSGVVSTRPQFRSW
jgi:carbonic anhydrase